MESKKKGKFHNYDEDSLQKAIIAIRNGGKLRETCRQYGVPKSTVQDRIKGKVSDVCKTMGPDPILKKETEDKLVTWIENLASCGFPIKKSVLLDTVQKIVKEEKIKTPFTDGRPGQSWFSGFMKRHSRLALKNAESLEKYRAQITEEYIRSWFQDLRSFLIKSNAAEIIEDPSRILNGDESGFCLCPKSGKVLGVRGRDLNIVKTGSSKENLTVLITFTADGRLCPPLVIFPYVKPPKSIVDRMPSHWVLGKSDSGWMRSDVFYEFVANDLNTWLENEGIQKPVLFLVDGHKSHMSVELSKFCNENGIILYALPPNATHLLQPADVSVFKPLKDYWREEVRKWQAENENRVVTKTEFCSIFEKALQNPKMSDNMKNGFKACGLYPFNPDAVNYKKCVQNVLENLTAEVQEEVSEADIKGTKKVILKLKPKLTELGFCTDTILSVVRTLIPNTNEGSGVSFFTQEEFNKMDVIFTDGTAPPNGEVLAEVLEQDENQNPPIVILQNVLLNPGQANQNTDREPTLQLLEDQIHQIDNEIDEITTPTTNDQYSEKKVTQDHTKEKLPPLSELMEDHYQIDNEIATPTINGKNPEKKKDHKEEASTPLSELMEDHYQIDNEITSPVIKDKCPETKIIQDRKEEKSTPLVVLNNSQTQPIITPTSSSFERHLSYPQPINKNPKRRQREKIPSAISSEAWRKYYEDKLNEKEEKENAKKKRKLEGIQKKQSKTNMSKTLINQRKGESSIRNKKKQTCGECEDELDSDTEIEIEKNVGCDSCRRWYHLGCTTFSGLSYNEVSKMDFICKLCDDE